MLWNPEADDCRIDRIMSQRPYEGEGRDGDSRFRARREEVLYDLDVAVQLGSPKLRKLAPMIVLRKGADCLGRQPAGEHSRGERRVCEDADFAFKAIRQNVLR